MKKNLLIALAAAGLTLASCGNNSNSSPTSTPATSSSSSVAPASSSQEEVKLGFTDGYYQFAFGNEGTSYNFFFHFYDNGVFYYQQMNSKGGIGYWELTNDKWTGKYAKTRDDKVNNIFTDGEFAKTLKLTTTTGKDAGSAGYDEATDSIYGFTSTVFATYGQQQVYTHFAEADSAWGVEASSAVCEYKLSSNEACKVTINHDGTYNDLMGDYLVEGKWTKNGDTYTLTPDDKSDTAATLKVSENAKTATYTPNGGTAQNLDTTAAPAQIVFTFVDDGNNGEGYTLTYGTMKLALEVKVEFYDDGSAIVYKYVGADKNENKSDGSWSGSTDGITSCNLEGNGISTFGENGEFTLVTSGSEIKMINAANVASELLKVVNGNDYISFLSDCTFVASLYSGAAKIEGTWDMPKYSLSMKSETANVACEMDGTSHAYTVTFSFTGNPATKSFEIAAADWGSKLMGHTSAPAELVTSTVGSSTITFYDNGTYSATFYGGQAGSCTGTWEWASQYSFSVTVDADYTSVVANNPSLSAAGLVVSFTIGGQATVSFTLTTEEWQKTK